MVSKTKKTKLIILSSVLATMSIGATVGIAIPMVNNSRNVASVQHSNNNNQNSSNQVSNNINKNDTTKSFSTNNLTFTVSTSSNQKKLRKSSRTTENVDDKWNKIIKTKTVSGKDIEFKRTTSFVNNRKYMPILAYDGGDGEYYGYTDTRKEYDVMDGVYPGWTKENIVRGQNNNYGIASFDYKASDINYNRFIDGKIDGGNGLTINFPRQIKTLSIDMYGVQGQTNEEKSHIIKTAIETIKPSFIQVVGLNDQNMPALTNGLDIYNGNSDETYTLRKISLEGGYTNINAITLPESLYEIEFRSSNFKHVNPLKIPKNASLIYDSAGNAQTKFTEIELGSSITKEKTKLTDSDLQDAVNRVYQDRIRERSFQWNFSGGYVFSWDLRGTGLYSFNNVTVPKLDDGTGRFYIAHVIIKTDGVNGQVNETIGNGNGGPSNDSQIEEWYDENENGWSKVSKVVVSSNGNEVPLDIAAIEIVGFINKYPNVGIIDIQNVKLKENKPLSELENLLKDKIIEKFGESFINNIHIVTSKENDPTNLPEVK